MRLRIPLLLLLATLLAIPAAAGAATPQTTDNSTRGQPVKVRALVLATFEGEATPWFTREHLTRTVPIAGLATSENPDGVVRCSARGLCVTVIGTTKSKSGPSTMALLRTPRLDLSRARFLLVGIAGTSSWAGTLGGVGIADWIADTDLGTDYVNPRMAHDPGVVGILPPADGWDPFDTAPLSAYDQAAYRLPLAGWAYRLTKDTVLADDATARAERAHYPEPERGDHPRVQRCDVAGNDAFWVGADEARRHDRITAYRVTQASGRPYRGFRCSSAFEDPGVAGALIRFGYLNRFVDVRTASDLEDERPGTTPADLYDLLHTSEGFAGYSIAVENEWRVGSRIAHAWTG